VLLSSHLLHEIEVIADDLVVIGNGRIVSQGTKTALLSAAGTIVRTDDRSEMARALAQNGVTSTPFADGALRADADIAVVGKIAFASGLAVLELRPADSAGLEEIFLELTSETQREGAVA
jgi:ABC-2 type transport system ATP-binding protein